MKIYIAGKITGDTNYKEKFDKAKQKVKANGNIALCPTFLDGRMNNKDCMHICLAMIDVADVVWFLDDWQDSNGAKLEHAYCQYNGIRCAYGKDFKWIKE